MTEYLFFLDHSTTASLVLNSEELTAFFSPNPSFSSRSTACQAEASISPPEPLAYFDNSNFLEAESAEMTKV